jgi:hypothetical protein
MSEKICIEPQSYAISGLKMDDVFTGKFLEILRKELPTSIIAHFCIGFSDSKDIISVSYDRREGKFILDKVYVEGEGSEAEPKIKSVVDTIKKVLT